mmetsp:Transcript_35517/g.100524  ORF Transcript_35517/g.100524 Transcript_35517/m.100524 type:complete len:200 (+) Transcript_35517:253-852(+)
MIWEATGWLHCHGQAGLQRLPLQISGALLASGGASVVAATTSPADSATAAAADAGNGPAAVAATRGAHVGTEGVAAAGSAAEPAEPLATAIAMFCAARCSCGSLAGAVGPVGVVIPGRGNVPRQLISAAVAVATAGCGADGTGSLALSASVAALERCVSASCVRSVNRDIQEVSSAAFSRSRAASKSSKYFILVSSFST